MSINFQQLFRNADEFAGISYKERPLRLTDTSEFDQLALQSIGGPFEDENDWRKRFKCYDHDLNILRNTPVKLKIPADSSKAVRRVIVGNNTEKAYLSSKRESWEKDIYFSHRWEDDICWEDESENQNENRQDLEIRICNNPEMQSGSWVRYIIWDDEEVEFDEHGNFQESSLVFEDVDEDSWLTLRPDKTSATASQDRRQANSTNQNWGLFQRTAGDTSSQLSATALLQDMLQSQQNPHQQQQPQVSVEYIQRLQKQERNRRQKADRLSSIRAVGFTEVTAVANTSVTSKRARDELLNRRRRFVLPTIDHAEIALRHRTTRDLKASELRMFKHPILTKEILTSLWTLLGHRMNFPRSQPYQQRGHPGGPSSAVSRLSVISSRPSSMVMADREDLSIADGDFLCVEYAERLPHLLCNPGMAVRILNFYRVPSDAETGGGDDRDREGTSGGKGAAKRLCSGASRLPRHLRYLRDEGRRNAGFGLDQDMDIPRLSEGQTIALEADEDSPFLGEVPTGQIQPSLYCNLFQAPLFPHRSQPTDFILVQPARKDSAAASVRVGSGTVFVVREFPNSGVFLSGQQEPLKSVPKPLHKLTKLQEDWILLQLTRFFDHLGDKIVDMETILAVFPRARFKASDLRKLLSRVAEELEDGFWKPKPMGERPQAAEIEYRISPEDLCLQESSSAGEFRLREIGIESLHDTHVVELWLERMLKWRKFCSKRAEKVKNLAKEYHDTQKGALLSQLAKKLMRDVQLINRKLDIGRAINERLLVTPWAATDAFIRGHREVEIANTGTGMLELTGPGDPSGIGEAFAFVRKSKLGLQRRQGRVDSRPGGGDDEDNEEGGMLTGPSSGPQISNTNKDLRRLSKKEAGQILVSLGMDPLDVHRLKRWDRIAMVREMGTKAQQTGTAEVLHRYARDKSKQVTLQEMIAEYREKCRVIGERQRLALSKTSAPEIDEEEKDDDIDDFDDLYEDVERAFQGEESRIGVSQTIGGNTSGIAGGAGRFSTGSSGRSSQKSDEEDMKALKALQNEVIQKPAKGAGSTKGKAGAGRTIDSSGGLDHPPRKVVKRITRKVGEDGRETMEIRFIVSESEIARVEHSKKLDGRQRARKGLGAGAGRGDGSDEERERAPMSLKFAQMKNIAEQYELAELDGDEVFMAKRFNRTGGRTTGASKRSGLVERSMRQPLMVLASELEGVLIELWKKKIAPPFHFPVDAKTYKDYRTKVSQPMSLLDIRNKIVRGHYKTAKTFLSDVKLMADNAALYNGANSQLAKDGASLYKSAQSLVDIYKKEFAEFERNIKAKFASLGRSVREVVGMAIPDVMMTAAIPVSVNVASKSVLNTATSSTYAPTINKSDKKGGLSASAAMGPPVSVGASSSSSISRKDSGKGTTPQPPPGNEFKSAEPASVIPSVPLGVSASKPVAADETIPPISMSAVEDNDEVDFYFGDEVSNYNIAGNADTDDADFDLMDLEGEAVNEIPLGASSSVDKMMSLGVYDSDSDSSGEEMVLEQG